MQQTPKRKRGRPRKTAEAPPIPLSHFSAEEEELILNLYAQKLGVKSFFGSLEELFTSNEGFGLTTATPVQRAICRIASGVPLGELSNHGSVQRSLGTTEYNVEVQPAEVTIVAGVRGAKSMIAAAVAIWASQKCDLSRLAPGEIPRFSIVSLSIDNAKVIYAHLLGALQQKRLQSLRIAPGTANQWRELIDETGADVIGTEFLWHSSGRPVEIRVVAGKRAGGSLVSRWSIGCVFDEAPRMVGAAEGVVNYDDARRAVRTRLLPGAQILSIGSPWQPYGPIYDIVQNEFGKPTSDRVVIKATGPDMNPFWWTPERCEEIKRTDPIAYRTDVEAEFADLEESLFPQLTIEKCLRKDQLVLPWQSGRDYVAAMDPATRNNAWTLVICDRKGRKKRVVYATQWIGSSVAPLSPRAVLKEAKAILADYKLDWAFTDQWAADALKDIAFELELALLIEDWTEKGKTDAFLSLATAMNDGTVELPNDPLLTKDLRLTKRVPTGKGVSIRLVTTPDGRHCDYASALARALVKWLTDEQTLPPEKDDPAYLDYWARMQEEREAAQLAAEKNEEWWAKDPHMQGVFQ